MNKFDALGQHDGCAKGLQGPSETLYPLQIRPLDQKATT